MKYVSAVACLFFIGCTMNPVTMVSETTPRVASEEVSVATFAGGCFWCIEPAYQDLPGVIDAVVGYAGGSGEDATYKKISTGKTGHREAVQVTYDPGLVTYEELVDIFWEQIDPTDAYGQFSDQGRQYMTAIFWHDQSQKNVAEASKRSLADSKKFEDPIEVRILEYTTFFLAEEYHQDFYKKSSDHYKRYKKASGRADFIEENWAKEAAILFSNEEMEEKYEYTPEEIENMRENLDPLSYHVVVEGGTESPFENAYWDNKADGIYVDKVTGEALFSSTHKYDSGTGWPSFYRTLDVDSVTYHEDDSLGVTRTEIKSQSGESHLGHVFDDGPEEKGGQRFCTNSASLEFIPRDEMAARGYVEFLFLFENEN